MRIKHAFNLDLTRKQKRELERVWREHGEQGGAIILQPVLNWGPFSVANCFANGAVLDHELMATVNDVIEGTKANPGVVKCASCGCAGNESCGHPPANLEKCCTLDGGEICPCCRAKEKEGK